MIEWAAAAAPLPGEEISGDAYVVKPLPQGVLVGVVDGLGHGREASVAASIAASTLEQHAHEPIDSLIQRCHTSLVRTRGVVLTLARFDARNDTMTWIGVGNVEGLLQRRDAASGSAREHVVARGGVVGGQLPPLRPRVFGVHPGDVLVLATDGLGRGLEAAVGSARRPDEMAKDMLERFGKETDDALVLVARYRGATT